MAAGGLSDAFNFTSRKRAYDNEDDDDDDMNGWSLYSAKRRNMTQLPIRSPPRPLIAVTPAFGQYGLPSGTLTPDSIPDNHGFANNDDEFETSRPHTVHGDQQRSVLHIDTEGSAQVSIGMDMDIGSPKQSRPPPTPVRIGRARSNDLMSPLRSPAMTINPSPTSRSFARDRLPTPVASSFPGGSPFESSFISAASRQLRPHFLQQSTTLSPMVDAESWTPQMHRPPSPDPEADDPFGGDGAMAGIEDSGMMNSSFTNLSVRSQDNLNAVVSANSSPSRYWLSQDSPTRGLGLGQSNSRGAVRPDDLRMSTVDDGPIITDHASSGFHNRQQSSSRTAKLHMGFRADCEKCMARVPGHYSHIIWTEATA